MMRWTALIIVVIIIIIVVAAPELSRVGAVMTGMWVGDPSFLKKADLSDMQLFIAPGRGRVRDGYIIMADAAGRFVINAPIQISYSFGWFPGSIIRAVSSNFRRQICGKIRFALDDPNSASFPFPEKLKFTLSVADSSMTLFGDKVFAFMYKDAIASNAAKETYEKSD